ncbi:translation initiation factor IF-2-like [Grus americana]|uniref:translation initiation factor IF-2-like n=1 Tax=Grus americana TaxID=9117 RepID=UPI002407CDA2|nr:translation initiation factor IF-2-like [Grus americana]
MGDITPAARQWRRSAAPTDTPTAFISCPLPPARADTPPARGAAGGEGAPGSRWLVPPPGRRRRCGGLRPLASAAGSGAVRSEAGREPEPEVAAAAAAPPWPTPLRRPRSPARLGAAGGRGRWRSATATAAVRRLLWRERGWPAGAVPGAVPAAFPLDRAPQPSRAPRRRVRGTDLAGEGCLPRRGCGGRRRGSAHRRLPLRSGAGTVNPRRKRRVPRLPALMAPPPPGLASVACWQRTGLRGRRAGPGTLLGRGDPVACGWCFGGPGLLGGDARCSSGPGQHGGPARGGGEVPLSPREGPASPQEVSRKHPVIQQCCDYCRTPVADPAIADNTVFVFIAEFMKSKANGVLICGHFALQNVC